MQLEYFLNINAIHLKVFLCVVLSSSICTADDWPQWLGPNREPVWRETGIIEQFPEDGPKLRWKRPIGGGYTGPAVANGRVFLMDRVMESKDLNDGDLLHEGPPPQNTNFLRRRLPGKERVVCLNEKDGKILCERSYDCPYTTTATYAIGPRCTPTVDGQLVYTLGAEGDLLCLNVADGTVVWSCDFKAKYDLQIPVWGVASHPLIAGDHLICMVGGPNATCVALNKLTGQEVWRSGSAREPGYCPPVIYEFGGERQLVIWDSDAVRGMNPETGEVFWSVEFEPTFAMSIGAPQQQGRLLFAMAFNRKSTVIRVGDDNRSAEIVWLGDTRRGIGGVLNTAVVRDGFIYACGNGGRYICAELETGNRRWSTFAPSTGKRPASWANVFTVRHEDRFFHANDFGDLIIAKMSPSGYQEISRAHLIEPTHQVSGRTLVWSHPAFANRSIYLRNDKEVRCYSLAKP